MDEKEKKGAAQEEPVTEFGVDLMVLTDEEGVDHEFELLGSTEQDGVKYFALTEYLTGDELLNSDGELYIMKQVGEDDADAVLDLVTEDDEYDRISKVFIEMLADDYDFSESESEE